MTDPKKPTILLVDDEKHIRMEYQEELELEGYAVLLAKDVEEGISTFRSCKNAPTPSLDLIILDIRLGPGQSGLDLLEMIRKEERERGYQRTPVILCTAYDSFQHDLKTIASDGYVVKSVDLTDLKNTVSRVLGR